MALRECAVPEACAFLWWVMAVGRLFFLQPAVTAPQSSAARSWGFFRAQSQRRLWARKQGGRVTVWKLEEPGGLGGVTGRSAHGGTRKLSGVLSPRFHCEGHLPGLLRAPAPDTILTGHPLSLRAEATAGEGRRTRLPAGKCVGWREGAEWGGVARRRRAGFSCSQRGTGGRRYYCSAGPGGPGTRGARRGL